jgi:simple sugar transport system permease protein
MDSALLGTLLQSTVTLAAPLVLACMAGYASERSGVVNIALEGKMVAATLCGAAAGLATHNPWLGLLAGMAAAVVLGLVHWVLTQTFRVDHIVSGMALNVFALGAANFVDRKLEVGNSSGVPVVPEGVLVVVALVVPAVLAWASRFTRWGLRLTAVGADPEKARQMGIDPVAVRAVALLVTGVLCGCAGALVLAHARFYTDGMVAGRGYIALAALILGGWKPLRALGACLVFGFAQALQLQLQGVPILGVELPREVWYSLPYLVTVVALAGFLGGSRPPAGLGKA